METLKNFNQELEKKVFHLFETTTAAKQNHMFIQAVIRDESRN